MIDFDVNNKKTIQTETKTILKGNSFQFYLSLKGFE